MHGQGGLGSLCSAFADVMFSLTIPGLTAGNIPVNAGMHIPYYYPPMTIAYLWGRHLARHKKGVHLRPGAGRRPNDGRASSVEMRSGLDGSDVPSPNPCQSHSSRQLVTGPCMQGRSSGSGCQGRDCADPTLRSPVHPSLLPDVGVDRGELARQYAAVRRWRAGVQGIQ